MNDSILDSIKKYLGMESDYNAFDEDIKMMVNSSLMALSQIGIGKPGFKIEDSTATWTQFFEEKTDVEAAKN